MSCCTVISIQGVEQWIQHTALRCASAYCGGGGYDMWGLSLNLCDRFVRKFLIQLQIGAERLRLSSLLIKMSGMIVLNTELKSMKDILTKLS